MTRTYLVTGATTGIGRAAALSLAAAGHRVVLTGHLAEEVDATVCCVRAVSPRGLGHGFTADFTELDAVEQLAAAVAEAHPCLDVLVHNAGILRERRLLTPDGHEAMLQVNYLAPFLLTRRLLPSLRAAGGGARIVHVASSAHKWGRLDLDDLGLARGFGGFRAYARSKLAMVLLSSALARRLDPEEVTSNALHPGVVGTDLGRAPGPLSWLMRRARPLLKRPDEGADTAVWLASDPDLAGVSGGYFEGRRQRRPARAARDATLGDELWRATETLLGLVAARGGT